MTAIAIAPPTKAAVSAVNIASIKDKPNACSGEPSREKASDESWSEIHHARVNPSRPEREAHTMLAMGATTKTPASDAIVKTHKPFFFDVILIK
jgi:hypothetical protein